MLAEDKRSPSHHSEFTSGLSKKKKKKKTIPLRIEIKNSSPQSTR